MTDDLQTGLTAVASGLEQPKKGQMYEPPRHLPAPILGWAGVLPISLPAVTKKIRERRRANDT